MTKDKRKLRTEKGLKEYTYLGCPLTNNRSAWCFRLCAPNTEGNGKCGRLAPHSMKSKIQLGIERQGRRKRLERHFEKLERMYLATPCNRDSECGVRISEGEAEIVMPVQERHRHPGGWVHSAVCFKAMDDSAALAVNSVAGDVLVRTNDFNIHFLHLIAAGEITARGRLVAASDDCYLAESVLVDSGGNEIARGSGVYVKSAMRLPPD